jgi:hypothetical protein
MRTKTLFIAAAALAAGLATSMAQSNVYSVNVVGYVNQALPAGQLALVANPLDNGTNDLDTTLGTIPNKATVSLWNGSGFDNATKQSTGWNPNMPIPPGVGFFVNSPSAVTNTYVGNVAANPGGNATNSLPAGTLALVGSKIPFAGDLNDTNLNLNLPNKSTISVWNGNGFDNATKQSTGWNPALPISVGQGFFVNSASAFDWVQTLPAN